MSIALRALAACAAAAALASCGAPQIQTSGESVADQIARLEKAGRIPRLDRSSDIAGPDQDGNQTRDDIQAWIEAKGYSDAQKKAALQIARALQQTVVIDPVDPVARNAARQGVTDAINCVSDTFAPDYTTGHRLVSQLEAMTANTRERSLKYVRYNAALSGSGWSLPNGNTCR